MRNFRRIIRVIVCVLLTFAILFGLDYVLYPCTFIRNDIHTVTSEPRDVIIMGTSNGKMGLDPDSMLEGTGLTGHNLCVGGEYPIDCYYMMEVLGVDDFDTKREKMLMVSKEEIVSVANKVGIHTIFCLKGVNND